MSATFLLVYFLSLKESTCKTRKNVFFISVQKLFSFSRKSNFRNLNIQVSWRHQMPKYKTINTFYWITWKVNTVCYVNKIWSVIPYYKNKNFMKKFCKNCDLETSSRPFCVCKELSTTSIGKRNFWSKLLISDMY